MVKFWNIIILFFFICVFREVKSQSPVGARLYLYSSDTSDQYTIDRIFIIGNRKTREKIIQRELNIEEGATIPKSEIDQILEQEKNKLLNTSLFLTVDFSVININQNLVDIIIRVSERWYLFPIPIFELADRNFNEWWVNQQRDLSRINYGLKLYKYNVRGMNETLRLTGQFGFTRQFQLYYSFPYIDRQQKIGLNILSDYSENTNINYRTINHKQLDLDSLESTKWVFNRKRLGIGVSYRRSFYNHHSLRVDYFDNKIRDTLSILNPHFFLNGRTRQQFFQLTYRFRRDLRDFAPYPLKGFVLNLFVDKLGLGIFDDINQLEVSGNYARFFDLGKEYYFSTNLAGITTFPDRQPYFNNNAIGYNPYVVRGYELYLLEGQHFIMGKTTLKKKLFDAEIPVNTLINIKQFQVFPLAVYIKTFFDAGYVFNDIPVEGSTLDYTNQPVFGYGLGLDLVTFYDMVFRWEYSINDQGESGLRFGLRAEF
jgi:outer membrane protein assembly factor BamA